MHFWPEGDAGSADVEFADLVDEPQHVCARRVWSGHFKHGCDEATGKISLQRNKIRRQMRVEDFLGSLVIGDDPHRGIPWKRHDLGSDARRNSAPVKGPMNGTFLATVIGTVATAVGVPTAPINAKT